MLRQPRRFLRIWRAPSSEGALLFLGFIIRAEEGVGDEGEGGGYSGLVLGCDYEFAGFFGLE